MYVIISLFLQLVVSRASQCPRFLLSDDHEILLPSGQSKAISLLATNLPQPRHGDEGYKCLLHVIGELYPQVTNAEVLRQSAEGNQTITCNAKPVRTYNL